MPSLISGSFTAGDSNGKQYQIVWTAQAINDEGTEFELKRLRTREDQPVKRLSQGRYAIVAGRSQSLTTSDSREPIE